MKKLFLINILFFIITSGFSQKDECSKYFKKERKSKKESSIFAEEKLIQTDNIFFYRDGSRQLFLGFKKTDKSFLVVTNQTQKGLKRSIVLVEKSK